MTTSFVRIAGSSDLAVGAFSAPNNSTGDGYFATSEAAGTVTVAKIVSNAISWQTKISPPSGVTFDLTMSPVISVNASGDVALLVQGTTESCVYKLNTSTGAITWVREITPKVWALKMLAGGDVFAGASSAFNDASYTDVLAIKLSSAAGATTWVTQLADTTLTSTGIADYELFSDYGIPASDGGLWTCTVPGELSTGDIILAHFASGTPSGLTKLNSSGAIQWRKSLGGWANDAVVSIGVSAADDVWVASSGTPGATGVQIAQINTSTGAVTSSAALAVATTNPLSFGNFIGAGASSVCASGAVSMPAYTTVVSNNPAFLTKPAAAPTGVAEYMEVFFDSLPGHTAIVDGMRASNGSQSANRNLGCFRVVDTAPDSFMLVYDDGIPGVVGVVSALSVQRNRGVPATYSAAAHSTSTISTTISAGTGALTNTSTSSSTVSGGLTLTAPAAGLTPTGLSSTAFGQPAYTYPAFPTGTLFATGFGTPVRTLNRTLTATGAVPSTVVGTPDFDLAFSLYSRYRPEGLNAAPTFGTPTANNAFAAQHSGLSATLLGTPTLQVRGAATGFASTAFGTAGSSPTFNAVGIGSTAVGTPTFGLMARVTSISRTRLGNPAATWRVTADTVGSVSTVFGTGAQAHLHFNPRSAVFRTSFGTPQATGP